MGIVNRVKDLINKIKGKIITSNLAEDNRGMGVIEVILIIVVLVGLVMIFRTQITTIVNNVFVKLASKISTF
ncbi:MAG: hypothetical protein IIT48_06700 [Lachnospiraceae bacterium]|nr:hypothetical protein [Lachnospiraceae bacterium]